MAIPREPKVAVVGATGSVGGQILQLIAEREFPAAQIKLFATASGAAGTVEKGDEEYLVAVLDDPSALAG